jgi:hypothetical protein
MISFQERGFRRVLKVLEVGFGEELLTKKCLPELISLNAHSYKVPVPPATCRHFVGHYLIGCWNR